MSSSSNKFQAILQKYIKKFDDDNKHSETHDAVIDGVKYFIKVVGKTKKEHMKNEIKSLRDLADIFPMYHNYFVDSAEDKDHCAILLRYIEGEDLKCLLDKKCSKSMVICLYRMLFTKLQMFHDQRITHGDVKPQNFYSYIDPKDGMVKLKLIDTETCTFHKTIQKVDDIKRLRSLYYYLPDNPRSSTFFKNKEEAFIFFRYLDHYSLACFMLYLLKPDVYKMLQSNGYKEDDKNPWRMSAKDLHSPYDYVDKEESELEKALHYVFKYIPNEKTYRDDLPKFSEEKLAGFLFGDGTRK
jgi:serine/threonine protein kinase